jgi:hypothetical protein
MRKPKTEGYLRTVLGSSNPVPSSKESANFWYLSGRLYQRVVTRLRAITPVVMPRAIPFRNLEHRELLLSGLRLAAGAAS